MNITLEMPDSERRMWQAQVDKVWNSTDPITRLEFHAGRSLRLADPSGDLLAAESDPEPAFLIGYFIADLCV